MNRKQAIKYANSQILTFTGYEVAEDHAILITEKNDEAQSRQSFYDFVHEMEKERFGEFFEVYKDKR
jgi:hypothetical protein